MRVRVIALALAATVMMSSAACAPDGYTGAVPDGPGGVEAAPQPPGENPADGRPADREPAGDPPPALPAGSRKPVATAAPKAERKPSGAPASTTVALRKAPPVPVVPSGLNFSALTVNGASFAGASLLGRPTVLWFWAPWCPTCHAQVPEVLATDREFAGKVNVVGVAGLDRAAPIRTFVADRGIGTLTNLSDTSGTVWKHFKITQQGTYVLIDSRGTVRYSGWVRNGDLAERVARLGR
jgi:thiol-disulfide isomerase/thioredoxin